MTIEEQKSRATAWFQELRDMICAAFEKLEDDVGAPNNTGAPGQFERTSWQRPDGEVGESGGGGVMSVMRGRVFEKVGVNVSVVHGELSPEFRAAVPGAEADASFWAAGISLVAHMHSPKVPAVHMNTRHIVTTKSWFGGGADITPMFPDAAEAKTDAADFHATLKAACDAHEVADFDKYKAWCDDYFFLPHRNEARGLGGIFFDYIDSGDKAADFAFTQDVGHAFLGIYPKIVRSRKDRVWTAEQREHQLVRRGRYVEFNLLHDRGTKFGLQTGGNVEAILMSMPPEAKWP